MSTSIILPNIPHTTTPPIVTLPSDHSTPVPDQTTCTSEVLLANIRNYGYAENTGIARRQQRALTLLTQGHVTPLDLTLTAGGCPIVVRFRVQSESGSGHYYVTRTSTTGTYPE